MCAGRRRSDHRPAPQDLQRGDRPVALVGPEAASLTDALSRLRHDATRILRAGVDAVEPAQLVQRAAIRLGLADDPAAGLPVIAAGKAAAGMLRGFLSSRHGAQRGIVAAMSPPPRECPSTISWFQASHPTPGGQSARAGREALTLAAGVREPAVLVVLLSGGASSLLALPADGVSLADKAAASTALMAAGVGIHALNAVRKHLSAIKGGWLGQAAGWRVVTLALSDVHAPVEDDPSVIGSGPTVPDASTYADALAVVRGSGAAVPAAVRARLEAGRRGEWPETPKPGAPGQARARFAVIGGRRDAMAGAAGAARAFGYAVRVLDDATGGEAREAGRRFAEDARREAGTGAVPTCVIASGEPTVTVIGRGRGGRNQEFVLGGVAALEAGGAQAAVLASAGTDGLDGPTDAAGAVADTATARRARARGVDVRDALARNDAYAALAALDALIVWGPTGTNVGDLHVWLTAGSSG